jgi:hypothetical protein
LTEAATRPGTCWVRSGTGLPCGGLAVVEILGVPFCERCAREQEAYFAMGELTQARGPMASMAYEIGRDRSFRDEVLLEALGRIRREFVGPAAGTRGAEKQGAPG